MPEVFEPYRGATTGGRFPRWEVDRAIRELNDATLTCPIPARKRIADLLQHLHDHVRSLTDKQTMDWLEREQIRREASASDLESLKQVKFWSERIEAGAPIAEHLAAVVRLATQAVTTRAES